MRIVVLALCVWIALIGIVRASPAEPGAVCLECEGGIIPLQDVVPTAAPTTAPSITPTTNPTAEPTPPTPEPTPDPTLDPTPDPTPNPTNEPTQDPTLDPTAQPTTPAPTPEPTVCVLNGNNCGGTNDFGVDAAVEACCDPADTCVRRNRRRWRCQ